MYLVRHLLFLGKAFYRTMNNTTKDIACIDITKDFLNKKSSNVHSVKKRQYFKYNQKKYNVDGKNVVLDYSQKELEIAYWLTNVYMLPRINNPKGIQTADYLWQGEYCDLKEISGNGKHTLDSAIKRKKSQASNFILDITNSNLSKSDVINQLKLIFKSKNRLWVNKIILKGKKMTIVLRHKKEVNHQS